MNPTRPTYHLRPATYRFSLCLCVSVVIVLAFAVAGRGQTNYLLQTGEPTFTTAERVELGIVNVSNGNLHLEVPLTSPPQRSSRPYTVKLIYDSRIWQVVDNGSSPSWQPTNVPPSPSNVLGAQGGWRLESTADFGLWNSASTVQTCTGGHTNYYGPYTWTAPDMTQHIFPIVTHEDFGCGVPNVPNGAAFAEDSSGYAMSVVAYTGGYVRAKDGTQVYPVVKDTNGNFLNGSFGYVVDTAGRAPYTPTVSGSTTYYDILNSQGTTSRVTVTATTINVNTNFGQAGVTDYLTGTLTVIQSIGLPDGTSYNFTYDCDASSGNPACSSPHSQTYFYGLLQSITLPAGGQVTYAYTTFADSNGNRNRWVNTRTAAGGTWTYAPVANVTCPSTAPPGSICQQTTLTKPSADTAVYTFILNNGSWNAQTDYYNQSPSPGNLLMTVKNTYDFSNPCTPNCSGSMYIRKLATTTTQPSAGGTSLTKKVAYTYDPANGAQTGNVTSIQEWKYSTGIPSGIPDRQTNITYLANQSYLDVNIADRVTDVKVMNGSGSTLAETTITYDSTPLTSVTGVVQHDDGNYGISYFFRGNPTLLQRWTGGSSWLSTTLYSDTTSQVRQSTDALGNTTTFSYSDNFFTDTGANPPAPYTPSQPTNAYLTQVTLPATGTLNYGYYYGSGKRASSTDQNAASTYQHYQDALDRLTHTYVPAGGWTLTQYPLANQRHVYTGLTDPTPSSGCTGCRHDQLSLDLLGRPVRNTLLSDPAGADNVGIGYDSLGRLFIVTTPYRTISDPTYGWDQTYYDGLDRITVVSHLTDANYVQNFYGAAVSAGGGNTSQSCSSATYGLGYPSLFQDEAGKKRETWTDGFGRTIEVDEPDPNNSNSLTLYTCYAYDLLDNLTQVVQGSQTRSYAYDALSRLTSATAPESGTTNFYYTTSGGLLCSGDPNRVCRRTDARGVTTTYAYDALNRLAWKTYSDSSPPAFFYYDEPSVTFNGTTYPLANTKGRLSHTGAPGGNTIYSYDAAGHVVDYWQCSYSNCLSPSFWNMHYTYDEAGDLATSTSFGYTVTNSLNTAQQITQISSSLVDGTHPANLAQSISYTPFGAIEKLVNGCAGAGCLNRQEFYSYNNRVQPVMIQVGTSPAPNANACLVYNYYSSLANPAACGVPAQGTGNNGNVLGYFYQDGSYPSLSHTASYTYDSLNRLTSSVATGSSTHNLTFTYDRYANMACQTNAQTQGPCPAWTFNPATNRLSTSGFAYDAAGNLTGDGTHTYQYNPEGQLVSVDNGGFEYIYRNALGQPVERITNTGTRLQVPYDAFGQEFGVYNFTAGSWLSRDFGLGSRLFAKYLNGTSFTGTVFLHQNHLGSVGMLFDHSGNPFLQDELFYPWGQQWATGGTVLEEHFAAFQQRDTSTGLDPTPNRMYASLQGRWLSPDPLAGDVSNPQSLNRYAYVLNNPATLTDPLGLRDEGPRALACSVNGSTGFSAEFCGSLYRGLFGRGRNLVDPDLLELRLDRPRREPREPTAQRPPPPPPPATQVSTIRLIIDVNRCASNVANSFSIASLTGLDKNRAANLVLSNNVASASQVILRSTAKEYVPAGTSLAVSRRAGSALVEIGKSLGSTEVSQGFQSIFTTVAPTTLRQTAAGGVAIGALEFGGELLNAVFKPQLFYDAAVYFGSLVACVE